MRTSDRSVSHPWSKRVSATSRTAVYGPVRTVVWEGRSREAPPYPDHWHETDMPTASSNVRVRGQSGKHMLALSSSQFDPERTSPSYLRRVEPASAGLSAETLRIAVVSRFAPAGSGGRAVSDLTAPENIVSQFADRTKVSVSQF